MLYSPNTVSVHHNAHFLQRGHLSTLQELWHDSPIDQLKWVPKNICIQHFSSTQGIERRLTNIRRCEENGTESIISSFQTGFKLLLITRVFTVCTTEFTIIRNIQMAVYNIQSLQQLRKLSKSQHIHIDSGFPCTEIIILNTLAQASQNHCRWSSSKYTVRS